MLTNACLAVLALLLSLTGCAGLPADRAAGTPAARVAASGLYSVQAHGTTVGAAVAVPCPACGGPVLVTNAHVMRQAGPWFELRPTAGGEAVAGRLLATSTRIDLAILAPPAGSIPARTGPAPDRGAQVWAVGPEGLGRAIAQGPVTREALRMRQFGSGFSARLGALMGFSGGPVVDRQGLLLGLTTALTTPSAAPVMAALTGMDLDGLLNNDAREAFVLSIQAIEAELARLAPQP